MSTEWHSAGILRAWRSLLHFAFTGPEDQFAIALATAGAGAPQRQLLAAVDAEAAHLGIPIAVCDVSASQDQRLLDFLERALEGAPWPRLLIVTGLSRFLLDRAGEAIVTPHIQGLNVVRDRMDKALPPRVLLLLDEASRIALRRTAPDLSDVMRGVYVFPQAYDEAQYLGPITTGFRQPTDTVAIPSRDGLLRQIIASTSSPDTQSAPQQTLDGLAPPAAESTDIDIFISYVHGDNGRGWVDTFERDLKAVLDQEPQTKDCRIWRDTAMSAGTVFDDPIQEALAHSTLFLALHSRNFQVSLHCQKELAYFVQHHGASAAGLRPGHKSRVLNILLHGLPESSWPPSFRGTLSVKMFEPFASNAHGFPASSGSEVYEHGLRQIATYVSEALAAYRKAAAGADTSAATEDRQTRLSLLTTSLRAGLRGNESLLAGLEQQFLGKLIQDRAAMASRAQQVVTTMVALPLADGLKGLNTVRLRFLAEQKPALAAGVSTMVTQILPLVCPPELLAQIQNPVTGPGMTVLTPRIGLGTMAEVVMSAHDARASQYQLTMEHYPSGQLAIPTPPVAGPDPDGQLAAADMESYVQHKLLPDLSKALEGCAGQAVNPTQNPAQRREAVNAHLDHEAKAGRTRYVLIQGASGPSGEHLRQTMEGLAKQFSAVVFLQLDNDQVPADIHAIHPLYDLLKTLAESP